MLDDGQRKAIDDLLDAVRRDPTVLPIEQLAAVRAEGMAVDVDRRGDETVVVASPGPDRRLDALSPREREVVMLAAAGFSNAQIADALFISLATVKDHVHSALRRTEMSSRTQLVAAWYGGLGPELS